MTNKKTAQGTILVVEDDESCAEMLRQLLKPKGYEVDCATTCAEGGRYLSANHYDWLILDYDLPDGNGMELLKHPAYQQTPAIAITGGNIRPPLREALDSGKIKQLLHKPFDLQNLLGLLTGS